MDFPLLLSLMLLLTPALADEFEFDPDSEASKAHLQEDLDGHIDKKVEDMNAEEIQFHYFRQHDYDGNEKLDGIELMSKLYQSEGDKSKDETRGVPSLKDEYITVKIDGYLNSADLNKDGYVDFAEYKKAADLRSRK